MKQFWITIGVVLTITAAIVTAGELVRASRKDPITPEVRDLTKPLRNCPYGHVCEFDKQTLHELYNKRSNLFYYAYEEN